MNGQSRQTDFPLSGPVLTPMFTIDVGYNYEFSNPVDHTIVGSTSSGRHNELQIMHLGLGTDFNYKGARGRLMTQLGLYSTMTPRNDASPDRGQWQLRDAYKYITEGYGGYHWDVDSGINVDAGIFLSYVGLCSYYNYENWTNQASYVSSNTPWFFNGIRIQFFPTDKLKIEPWIINGWQSYGEFNSMPGLGFQIAYRPNGAVAMVFSGYYGKDAMGNSDSHAVPHRQQPAHQVLRHARLVHEQGRVLADRRRRLRGWRRREVLRAATRRRRRSTSWARCSTTASGSITTRFGLTVGGGVMTNPGRYLVLTPPINGATAFYAEPVLHADPRRPVQGLGHHRDVRLHAEPVRHLPRGVHASLGQHAVLRRATAA